MNIEDAAPWRAHNVAGQPECSMVTIRHNKCFNETNCRGSPEGQAPCSPSGSFLTLYQWVSSRGDWPPSGHVISGDVCGKRSRQQEQKE